MGTVLLDISMSLDGFVARPNHDVEALHRWAWEDDGVTMRHDEVMEELKQETGAIVAGRRVYDLVDGWGGSHPVGAVPVFVLTHNPPQTWPHGKSTFVFVTDGVESAVRQAKAASGDKKVYVMGGAALAQEALKARVLDEIQIHLAPVLYGEGIRLFDDTDHEPIELEIIRVIQKPEATHLLYRILK